MTVHASYEPGTLLRRRRMTIAIYMFDDPGTRPDFLAGKSTHVFQFNDNPTFMVISAIRPMYASNYQKLLVLSCFGQLGWMWNVDLEKA